MQRETIQAPQSGDAKNQPPQLAFTQHGGRGPHMLMVHGMLSSQAQWIKNIEALQDVCQPVTVDLWGHGASPAPSDTSLYAPEYYVTLFDQIRNAVGADRWFVCGYSLGAGLTYRYCLNRPDHILGHIFTNSASGFAASEQVREWQNSAPTTAAKVREDGIKAIERIPVHPRFAKRIPADIKAALLADTAKLSPEGIANTLLHTNATVSMREHVAQNPHPTLLCFGRHEKKFVAAKEWLAQHMPKLQIADLNAGHAVNMEDVAGFNQAIIEFISDHAEPNAG